MNSTIKTLLNSNAKISADARAFDIVDNKGRIVGARTSIEEQVFVDAPADMKTYGYWTIPAGTSYILNMRATRGGVDFGPAFNRSRHATLAEAQAKQAKYFKDAEKRARKQFPVAA